MCGLEPTRCCACRETAAAGCKLLFASIHVFSLRLPPPASRYLVLTGSVSTHLATTRSEIASLKAALLAYNQTVAAEAEGLSSSAASPAAAAAAAANALPSLAQLFPPFSSSTPSSLNHGQQQQQQGASVASLLPSVFLGTCSSKSFHP